MQTQTPPINNKVSSCEYLLLLIPSPSPVMSDRCGVESVVLTLSLVHSAGNLLTWQAGGVWEVLAGRLVVGASVHTVWEGMFVLLQENTRPQHRPATAALMNYSETQHRTENLVQFNAQILSKLTYFHMYCFFL